VPRHSQVEVIDSFSLPFLYVFCVADWSIHTQHVLNAVAKQVELKDIGDEIAAIQQRMQGEAASAARKIADTALV
jgi:hypothetical protein